MVIIRHSLACCTRDRESSFDFDEQERVMTYNGLESYILNSHDNESSTSHIDRCATDSLEDDSSCSSSCAFGSFSSHWNMMKRDEQGANEWEFPESPQKFYTKQKPAYMIQFSDVETMKEKFAKLLLGEDVTGGSKGAPTALALSNEITTLAASVFGELWKLEPLMEEMKSKWQREMDWLLSPTNYMVELVPAKQNGANGQTLEIMTPKVRADIHINIPALQKLDSMLIEILDSFVGTEFWYVEGGSRAEGRSACIRQSKRWWLPSPLVPTVGLSDTGRKKLLYQAKLVHQIFKAAKSINKNVLVEMPFPNIIRDAFPKSGKASVGEELYRILLTESTSPEETLKSLNLKSEHDALDIINRLEAAVFVWKERMPEVSDGKSPLRTSWSFIKDQISDLDKTEFLLERGETILQQLKTRYPNLPQTFLDATKIQYNKDVGYSILEAYSRVLGNLAFSILTRIGDILQEDVVLAKANSPGETSYLCGINLNGILDSPAFDQVRHSLISQINIGDAKYFNSMATNAFDEQKTSSVASTPSRSRLWCITREVCSSMSPQASP